MVVEMGRCWTREVLYKGGHLFPRSNENEDSCPSTEQSQQRRREKLQRRIIKPGIGNCSRQEANKFSIMSKVLGLNH